MIYSERKDFCPENIELHVDKQGVVNSLYNGFSIFFNRQASMSVCGTHPGPWYLTDISLELLDLYRVVLLLFLQEVDVREHHVQVRPTQTREFNADTYIEEYRNTAWLSADFRASEKKTFMVKN